MFPRRAAAMFASVLVAGCMASVVPSSTAPAPASPNPTRLPATSRPQATLPPAKCAGMDQTFFGVVGWRGPRVELQRARFIGCDAQSFSFWSVDPAHGDWQIDASPGVAESQASDGQTVVLAVGGRLLLIGADGATSSVPGLPGPPLVGGISPLRGGGYVFTGVPRLDRLMPGTYRPKRLALPSGFAVASATSDPATFILALASEAARIPWGLTKEPYHVYLWTLGSARPRLISASAFARPAGIGLAYVTLAAADGATEERVLGRDGVLRTVVRPGASWLRSPDDWGYLDLPDPNSEAAQTISLRTLATGRVIEQVHASLGIPAWQGQQVAFVPRPADDSDSTTLIVLGPGLKLELPVP